MSFKEELQGNFHRAIPCPREAAVVDLAVALADEVLIPLIVEAAKQGNTAVVEDCNRVLKEISLWLNKDPTVTDNEIRELCLKAVGQNPD